MSFIQESKGQEMWPSPPPYHSPSPPTATGTSHNHSGVGGNINTNTNNTNGGRNIIPFPPNTSTTLITPSSVSPRSIKTSKALRTPRLPALSASYGDMTDFNGNQLQRSFTTTSPNRLQQDLSSPSSQSQSQIDLLLPKQQMQEVINDVKLLKTRLRKLELERLRILKERERIAVNNRLEEEKRQRDRRRREQWEMRRSRMAKEEEEKRVKYRSMSATIKTEVLNAITRTKMDKTVNAQSWKEEEERMLNDFLINNEKDLNKKKNLVERVKQDRLLHGAAIRQARYVNLTNAVERRLGELNDISITTEKNQKEAAKLAEEERKRLLELQELRKMLDMDAMIK